MTERDNSRRIRSYVLRTGRMTPVQRRALEEHWQHWGLEYNGCELAYDAVFGRSGPVVLEIGFGMGQSLVAMAAEKPETNFIGIEVHKPGSENYCTAWKSTVWPIFESTVTTRWKSCGIVFRMHRWTPYNLLSRPMAQETP